MKRFALALLLELAGCASASLPSPYAACDRNPDQCHGCGDAGAQSSCPGTEE